MRPKLISDSRVVSAPAAQIFVLLSDPACHPEIDGSGTVQQLISDPGPMQLGSEFKMAMKIFGYRYKMTNTGATLDGLVERLNTEGSDD